jgi:hypothetical protein
MWSQRSPQNLVVTSRTVLEVFGNKQTSKLTIFQNAPNSQPRSKHSRVEWFSFWFYVPSSGFVLLSAWPPMSYRYLHDSDSTPIGIPMTATARGGWANVSQPQPLFQQPQLLTRDSVCGVSLFLSKGRSLALEFFGLFSYFLEPNSR